MQDNMRSRGKVVFRESFVHIRVTKMEAVGTLFAKGSDFSRGKKKINIYSQRIVGQGEVDKRMDKVGKKES